MNEDEGGMHPDRQDPIARLPREIAPPGDLWPGIAAAIGKETSGAGETDAAASGLDESGTNEADPAALGAEAMLRRVTVEVEPPDVVWAGIAEAIASRADDIGAGTNARRRAAGPWAMPFAIAASIAAIAIVGALLVRPPALEEVPDGTPASVAAAGELLPPELWVPASVSVGLEDESFASARQTYLEQIAVVREERTDIEALLTSYPDEPALRELWMHAYQTELLLIDEAARVLTMIQSG